MDEGKEWRVRKRGSSRKWPQMVQEPSRLETSRSKWASKKGRKRERKSKEKSFVGRL